MLGALDAVEGNLPVPLRGTGPAKLHAALAPWRGPPLAEFAHEPFAQAHAVRLEDLLGVWIERTRAEMVADPPPPTALVRRGQHPGRLAAREATTRFPWSLTAAAA